MHLLTPSPFPAPDAVRVQELWALLRARGVHARGVHARRANPWHRQRRGGCGTLVATGAETGTESAEGRCVPLAQ